MDDEIELMCMCGWKVSFTPLVDSLMLGQATHAKHRNVAVTGLNARKITERLFIEAQKLDPTLREEAAL